jgi:hypothetical protein
MIEGKKIICFSTDWEVDPLSKKRIIKKLVHFARGCQHPAEIICLLLLLIATISRPAIGGPARSMRLRLLASGLDSRV